MRKGKMKNMSLKNVLPNRGNVYFTSMKPVEREYSCYVTTSLTVRVQRAECKNMRYLKAMEFARNLFLLDMSIKKVELYASTKGLNNYKLILLLER